MVELRAWFHRIPATRKAYAGLCVTTLAWAAAFILGKVVLLEIGALPAAAWRHAVAAVVLLPFAGRVWRSANLRAALPSLALMVVCGGVLYPWAFFAALARTSATNTSLLIALNPALTFLLAPLVGEPYTRRGLFGIGLALCGAALVITHGDLAVVRSLGEAHSGDLLALAAAGLWASFNLASRNVVLHVPHTLTNALVYGIGSVALFALAGPEEPVRQVLQASPAAVGALAGMVVLSSLLAGLLFLHGVRTVGVSRTVVFVYLVPVLTAVASALLLDEPIAPAQILGGVAVMVGVFVTTRPMRATVAPRPVPVEPALDHPTRA